MTRRSPWLFAVTVVACTPADPVSAPSPSPANTGGTVEAEVTPTVAAPIAAPTTPSAEPSEKRPEVRPSRVKLAAGAKGTCIAEAEEVEDAWKSWLVCWGTFGSKRFRAPRRVGSDGDVVEVTGDGCERMARGGVSCLDSAGRLRAVSGISHANDLASRGERACAVEKTGAVACWRLADLVATAVEDVARAAEVAVGHDHTCALHVDGTVSCWGNNDLGQLGRGDRLAHAGPSAVPGVQDVRRIDAGAKHTCGWRSGQSVVCWGANEHGQSGAPPSRSVGPTEIADLTHTDHMSLGDDYSCVLGGVGTLECWGSDAHGLIRNRGKDTHQPIVVARIPNGLTDLATGARHGCGLDDTFALFCWGDGAAGQLGLGKPGSDGPSVYPQRAPR